MSNFQFLEVQLYNMDGKFEKTSHDMTLVLSLDASSKFHFLPSTLLHLS